MNRLEAIIKDEIRLKGEISFVQFMEMALYYPELGYYTSSKSKIGGDGDFYTSPDVDDLFGRLIGRQVVEMWEKLGNPSSFFLVEYGAGKGLLARDILTELKSTSPALYDSLTYGIVEISPSLRQTQQKLLSAAGLAEGESSRVKVKWVDHIHDLSLGPITGCIISNELIDAFPVQLVQRREEGVREGVVRLDENNNFIQEFSAPICKETEEFLQEGEIDLNVDQIIEVNRAGIKWLEEMSTALREGYVITIDYGYLAKELAVPHRFDGTLLCYEKHQVKENPYENVGGRDITAHVNFTSLMKYGEKFGLINLGYITQGKFLLNMGVLNWLEEQSQLEFDLERFRKNQRIKQLIMPGGMGDTFKVLVQGKGLGSAAKVLTSLKTGWFDGRK
ncbi:MAG: SAM-dependent methyltransferase [Clostridia bacterium]|nr:SAM-dependent methyltransferase [Clostridia bacterium]